MKNIMQMALVTVLAVLAAPADAADTSTTVVERSASTTAGYKDVVGLVKATAGANADSAGAMTVDAPTSSQSILGWTAETRASNGAEYFPLVTLSGSTFTVADSGGTSGTLVSGSTVTISIVYDRDE
jgi:hypothetical protein